MRTFSRLSTAIAISILAAALGASCALPAYLHDTAGGTTSGGGGGGGVDRAGSVTSGGQGGEGGSPGPSTSSGGSPGPSSGSVGGGLVDGGPMMCSSPLLTCSNTDHVGGPCGCPKFICMKALCKTDMDAGVVDGLFCKGGTWTGLTATLECCPDAPSCDAGKICQIAVGVDPMAGPQKIVTQCIPPGANCPPGKPLTCDCFLPGNPCSQFPGTHCSIHPQHDVVICTP